METSAQIWKVTAFVTRGTSEQSELLVFRHPTAGVQLPAGTVEHGETPEQAAIREVREETGLTQVALVAPLLTLSAMSDPSDRMITRTTRLYTEPSPNAATTPIPLRSGRTLTALRNGLWVRFCDETGAWSHVRYESFEEQDGVLVLSDQVEGWIETDACTGDVFRQLFHLTTTQPTPDHWTHDSVEDGILDVELFWENLNESSGLVEAHRALLDRVRGRLFTS